MELKALYVDVLESLFNSSVYFLFQAKNWQVIVLAFVPSPINIAKDCWKYSFT